MSDYVSKDTCCRRDAPSASLCRPGITSLIELVLYGWMKPQTTVENLAASVYRYPN